MKRIFLIVIYCIALSTLVACGNNPDRAKVSNDFSTIYYGGTEYHEVIIVGAIGYRLIDESPIKVGSFFTSLQFGFIPIYVSDFDTEKNILYANIWMWKKEGFEFPDHFTCRIKKIDAWSNMTATEPSNYISTLWEDEEETLTLEDIVDKSNEVDDVTGKVDYGIDFYLEDYPYLLMPLSAFVVDSNIYICLTIGFDDHFYKVVDEYVPMFDF